MEKTQVVLAINPGTRYLGLAIFHGNQLIDWRIKVLKGQWAKAKLNKAISILDNFIDKYRPDYLAIKKLHPSRSSHSLNALSVKVLQLGLRYGLKIKQYSVKELEAILCREVRRNKRNLAEAVAADYPDLYSELHTEKIRKNPYHMRMFEAVALGAVCIRKLDNY